MRVIIAGGRDFNDYELLQRYMLELDWDIDAVVCGCARGADDLGRQYAEAHGIPVDKYPADWDKYGRSAGPIRNNLMARNADALIAFWDGVSRGTRNMINEAKGHNLKVKIVMYKDY